MKVEEIRFNHDKYCAKFDALNIRDDVPQFLSSIPKQTGPAHTLPIPYAKRAIDGEITIRVRFSDGPSDQVRRIGAIVPPAGETLTAALDEDSQEDYSLSTNVLGAVSEMDVYFDSTGSSALEQFRLPAHQLPTVGVGRYSQHWRWRFRDSELCWNDFDDTYRTVYVLIGLPTLPWSQEITNDDTENLRLPWIDALDIACRWARGATHENEAAAMITHAINTHPRLVYDDDSKFLFDGKFLLSCFIDQLKGSRAFRVNCTDCASAVATLSNLLGCDLSEGVIRPAGADFDTNRVLLIGEQDTYENWGSQRFSYHEVAWLHHVGRDEYVYDACLHVDLNYDDASKDPLPKLPVAMPFSPCASDGYAKALVKPNKPILVPKGSLRRELL